MIILLPEKGVLNMSVTKLYQRDVYIKEWDAVITKVTEDGIYLDQTAFFPEGGGQSCDLGTIRLCDSESGAVTPEEKGGRTLQVTDVQEDGDDVIHLVSSPEDLHEGSRLHCRLDWDRRFDNMQRHCGEHILSGIFYQAFRTGWVLKYSAIVCCIVCVLMAFF